MGANTSVYQGASGPFYEDLASNSIQGVAPKAHGDSDRHNLEYQECEAHPHAMLVASEDLSDANLLQTPPMCFEELHPNAAGTYFSSYQRYQRRLLQ